MDPTKGSTLPSKGEVAFRFIACTTIALTLYYTPALRWSSSASEAAMVQAEAMLTAPLPSVSFDTCASVRSRGRLIATAGNAN